MRVVCLQQPASHYSCRSYLVMGDWSAIEDVNALVDPGMDGHVIEQIDRIYTGVGKKPVDQVVLTHNHFDHAAGARAVKEKYGARVLAWLPGADVDRRVNDGEMLRLGDAYFEVIHVPVHSEDSIALYCQADGVLFSGDTSLRVLTAESSYSQAYLSFLERLAKLQLKMVYSGHDPPVKEGIDTMLAASINLVRKSLQLGRAI